MLLFSDGCRCDRRDSLSRPCRFLRVILVLGGEREEVVIVLVKGFAVGFSDCFQLGAVGL